MLGLQKCSRSFSDFIEKTLGIYYKWSSNYDYCYHFSANRWFNSGCVNGNDPVHSRSDQSEVVPISGQFSIEAWKSDLQGLHYGYPGYADAGAITNYVLHHYDFR